MADVFNIIGTDTYVVKFAEYSNGILTTAGLHRKEKLKQVPNNYIWPITFDIDGATELPIYWSQIEYIGIGKLLDIDFINRRFISEKGPVDTVTFYTRPRDMFVEGKW